MAEIVDAIDRISELPDEILHDIMSHLSTKERARTSILSKRWNHLRKSFSILLDFDETYFIGKDLIFTGFKLVRQDKKFREFWEKFIKFVDVSLLKFCEFNSCMKKFRLCMTLFDVKGSISAIEKWIQLALERKVEELDLCLLTHRNFPYALDDPEIIDPLPRAIFSAKSLTALKLCTGCKLELPSDAIGFHSLQKLTLDRIYINGDMIKKLIAECPLLKDLSLFRCRGFKRLIFDDMSKYPSLENLFVRDCLWVNKIVISSERLKNLQLILCAALDRMVVDTPNLLSFFYLNAHKSFFYGIPKIHTPCAWKVAFIDHGRYRLSWLETSKEFLGASNRIEDLSIFYDWKWPPYSPPTPREYNELRKSSPSLPCEVESLALYIDASPSHYEALLNNCLLICSPKTLSVMTCSGDAESSFSEWLYGQLRDRCTSCCTDHDIKCCQRHLKDVKIESEDPKPRDNIHNFMYEWPRVSQGICQLRLDWCFPAPAEEEEE